MGNLLFGTNTNIKTKNKICHDEYYVYNHNNRNIQKYNNTLDQVGWKSKRGKKSKKHYGR
jgi:hypothetical protein